MCQKHILPEMICLMALVLVTGTPSLFGQASQDVNPFPETPEEIAAYKKYLIKRHHQKVSNYAEKTTYVSTLGELFEFAGKSGVHVQMEPGVYEIGMDNYEHLWDGGNQLLHFSGDHSFYDLRGVELRIDTILQPSNSFSEEVRVTGNRVILQGLTVTMVGNHPNPSSRMSDIGGTFNQSGSNNLIHGVRINARGSYPYGYQTALHAYREWNFSNVPKRRAVAATGTNNVYADVEIYHRGNGHALTWSGDVSHTWIDCHIEGKLRLSDDILETSAGGFYDDPSELPEDFNLSKHMSPGRIITLGEDAFRSYGGGKTLKVLGGTIKSHRDAFKRGSYDKVFISNVEVRGVRNGPFLTGGREMTRIVNCRVGLLCGYIMRRLPAESRVDITLVPHDPEILPSHSKETKRNAIRRFIRGKGRSGWITGHRSTVVLRAGENVNENKLKGRAPFVVDGKSIQLTNKTTLPVKLSEDSRNCDIITKGDVTDNGENNRIKQLD